MAKKLKDHLRAFIAHVTDLEKINDDEEDGFTREFMSLREITLKDREDETYPTVEGKRECNVKKNRYKDILPFDTTRVTLTTNPSAEPGSDYINANFVKGVSGKHVYIAAQGPLPHTVTDFWRMIWQYNVEVIVMVCREVENARPKCERYWAKDSEEKTFEDITVSLVEQTVIKYYFTVRRLRAVCAGEERIITQYHYTGWMDHDIPHDFSDIIEMITMVREVQNQPDVPFIVHCSAGCGRTGTICAIDYAWTLLRTKLLGVDFNLYEIIADMRKQRQSMVQTPDQYRVVHQAVQRLFTEYLTSHDLSHDQSHDESRDSMAQPRYENVVVTPPVDRANVTSYCNVDIETSPDDKRSSNVGIKITDTPAQEKNVIDASPSIPEIQSSKVMQARSVFAENTPPPKSATKPSSKAAKKSPAPVKPAPIKVKDSPTEGKPLASPKPASIAATMKACENSGPSTTRPPAPTSTRPELTSKTESTKSKDSSEKGQFISRIQVGGDTTTPKQTAFISSQESHSSKETAHDSQKVKPSITPGDSLTTTGAQKYRYENTKLKNQSSSDDASQVDYYNEAAENAPNTPNKDYASPYNVAHWDKEPEPQNGPDELYAQVMKPKSTHQEQLPPPSMSAESRSSATAVRAETATETTSHYYEPISDVNTAGTEYSYADPNSTDRWGLQKLARNCEQTADIEKRLHSDDQNFMVYEEVDVNISPVSKRPPQAPPTSGARHSGERPPQVAPPTSGARHSGEDNNLYAEVPGDLQPTKPIAQRTLSDPTVPPPQVPRRTKESSILEGDADKTSGNILNKFGNKMKNKMKFRGSPSPSDSDPKNVVERPASINGEFGSREGIQKPAGPRPMPHSWVPLPF